MENNIYRIIRGSFKKVHAQERKIRGTKVMPHNSVVADTKTQLENTFLGTGRVNPRYAEETVIALEYAKAPFHFITKKSMLEDVVSHSCSIKNN